MYHPTLIQRSIERFESKYRISLKRYSVSEVDEWKASLPEPVKNVQPELTLEQAAFIANERVMTSFDFLYWAERYAYFIADPETGPGGLQRFSPWETQRLTLERTAKAQLEDWERKKRGETVWGLRRVDYKGRQLGETQLACLQTVHRITRCMYQRGMAASVSQDKVQELYDRHKTIYDNLPWYLKPEKKYDAKAQDFQLKDTGGTVLYQNATQEGGISQGRQRELNHITEMAHWDEVAGWGTTQVQFELQFLPTLPRSIWALTIIESTPLVSGDWWHNFTERVRSGKMPGWIYNFLPYYTEPKRYRATAPIDWKPNEVSLRHARMVWETSPEWVGKRVMLTRDQLYWWETSYIAAHSGHSLNLFLTNFPCTPEQGFQHATRSAIDSDILDFYKKHTQQPGMYRAEVVQ